MNKWTMPGKNYFDKPGGFPFKAIFTIVLIIFVSFFTYNALTIPQGEKYAQELLNKSFKFPAGLSMLIVGITVTFYRVYAFHYKFSEYLESYEWNKWKNWAIDTLVMLDYFSITPVPDLALKIQKLEGEAPLSPSTPLRIEIEPDSMDESRLQKILIKLIEPLKESLRGAKYQFQTWIYVKGGSASVGDELNSLFSTLQIPRNITGKIYILETCPDYSLINKWIDEDVNLTRLLITIELHDESNLDFFESANAFIFTHPRLLNGKDTPTYLLRTMDSDNYYLDKIAKAYFSAKQVEVDKIKRLWSSSLDKQAKFILYAVTEDSKTGIMADSRYELEAVTGGTSPVQQRALVALATDAAKFGQGHQLIAGSAGGKVYTGIVTAKDPGWWSEPWEFNIVFYWLSTAIFWSASLIFFMISLIPDDVFEESGWIALVFILLITVLFIVIMGLLFYRTMSVIQSEMGIYHPDYS